MVNSAFESWGSIFLNPKKILIVRTHPEELRVIKCISSTHISTNFSQQWGQQMLTKCYPTSQGCSCDFQRLKVWPLGVPKPYRTSSYDVPSLLKRSTVCVIFWILWNQTQTQKVLVSSETMRHRMRMFDMVLERPKVLLLVLENPRNIPVILGNTWSTSVDLGVA